MRSKKALINTVSGLAYEVVAVICGLMLPYLIINNEDYGSAVNGITQAIAQFLSCIALMKAGIGGVTRAALYKALAKNDIDYIKLMKKEPAVMAERLKNTASSVRKRFYILNMIK